ncbi:hypothetical protein GWP49_29960, partial [Klebsiella pneumoniae]|nr:hypothetical protein [Klebsiella pneumoniae]
MAGRYTKEELIEILQQKSKELGRSPKYKEVKEKKAVVHHFGTFINGLEAAGLKPSTRYTKEELIEIIQKRTEELGRTPKRTELKQAGSIINHFGSFNKGLAAAGLTPGQRSPYKNGLEATGLSSISNAYTKEELIEILKQQAAELGRSPRFAEVKQVQSIIKQFGSFNNALKAAGLSINRVGTRTKPYTKEELIEILCQKANELGRSPKFYEVIQRHTVIKYFGSFNEGLIAAGLSPNKKTKRLK